MALSKHIETVQLPSGELRVVEDTTAKEVQVYDSTDPDPIAVFGYDDDTLDGPSSREARIRGVEYANGYAHAEGGDD